MQNHSTKMKRLSAILVISLFFLYMFIPIATADSIKVKPIQGDGYKIEKMKHWIDDGKNSVMIWGRVKNTNKAVRENGSWTPGESYWADIVAWVVDDDGEGEEIARYYNSLGYLSGPEKGEGVPAWKKEGEDKLFTISFPKDKKWREAKRPLKVFIRIIPKKGPIEEVIDNSSNALCCF